MEKQEKYRLPTPEEILARWAWESTQLQPVTLEQVHDQFPPETTQEAMQYARAELRALNRGQRLLRRSVRQVVSQMARAPRPLPPIMSRPEWQETLSLIRPERTEMMRAAALALMAMSRKRFASALEARRLTWPPECPPT